MNTSSNLPGLKEQRMSIAITKISDAKKSGRTKSINLTKLRLSELPEQLFENCPYVEELYIGNNNFRTLPKGISQLKYLKVIHAQNCGLTSLGDELFKLEKLHTLNLSKNNLESIPDEIGQLSNLRSLFLDNNNIKKIPSTIGDLKNLKNLMLSNNSIEFLPHELSNLTNLSLITLHNNNIKFLGEDEKKESEYKDNAIFLMYRYFLNTPNQEDGEGIHKHRIKFPEKVRNAFHQYFTYFNSYVETVTGRPAHITISEDSEGLVFSVPISEMDIINSYMMEYISFIEMSVESIRPDFKKEFNENEKELATLELRQQVRHLTMQLEMKDFESRMIKQQINDYKEFLIIEKQHPQPIQISISSAANAHSSSTSKVNFNLDLPELQKNLLQLKLELTPHLSGVQAKELEAIDLELMNVNEFETDTTKVNKGILKRLKRIIDQLHDPESEWSKAVNATKKGVKLLQGLGRSYNKIASWLIIPTIPEVFLGKKE